MILYCACKIEKSNQDFSNKFKNHRSLEKSIYRLFFTPSKMLQELAAKFSGLDIRTRQIIGGIILFVAALAPVLSVIGRVSTGVSALVSAFGKIKGAGAALGPVINVVKSLFTGFGAVASTIGKGLLTGIGMIKTALSGLFAVMMANPIVLVIAAVVALVAGFVLLWNKSEAFRQFWINLWNNIKNVVTIAWEGIKNFLTTVWTAISSIATTIWTGIKNFFSMIWNGIKTVFSVALNAIKTVVTTYFNFYKTIITTILNVIKTVVSTIWNGIKTVISTILSGIKNTISTIWNSIKSVISTVVNTIKSTVSNAFHSMWNGVKTVIGGIYNTIKSGFDKAVSYIKGLASLAFTWGKDMIMGIVRGIRSCIGAVGDAVKGVADKIKSFLHFSVPDEGPLTDYESWMPDFMAGLAKGINKSKYLVEKAVSGLATNMTISPNMQMGSVTTSEVSRGSNVQSTDLISEIKAAMPGIKGGNEDIVIPVYIGGTMLDEIIVTAEQRTNLRSGGR